MSDTAQVSSMPLPPMQYVNLFTEENVKRGRTPRPPPAIADGYTMFGNPFHNDDPVIRPLESQVCEITSLLNLLNMYLKIIFFSTEY